LLLDDIQFVQGKTLQAELGHAIHALLESGKPIVVAGDRPPAQLESLDERVRSRLGGGLVADIGCLDESLRLAILRKRLEALQTQHPTFSIENDVLDYVAQTITASARDLEGAMNRLLAHATLANKPVSVDMAEIALRDMIGLREQRRVTVEGIQKFVSERYGLPRTDLLSQRRSPSIVRPRQIAMYLSKVLTQRSMPEIGRRFGGRDHTTVLHAVRRIEKEITTNPSLAEEVDLMKRMLLE
jgi:chromosomal replication initiator protein